MVVELVIYSRFHTHITSNKTDFVKEKKTQHAKVVMDGSETAKAPNMPLPLPAPPPEKSFCSLRMSFTLIFAQARSVLDVWWWF